MKQSATTTYIVFLTLLRSYIVMLIQLLMADMHRMQSFL